MFSSTAELTDKMKTEMKTIDNRCSTTKNDAHAASSRVSRVGCRKGPLKYHHCSKKSQMTIRCCLSAQTYRGHFRFWTRYRLDVG